MEGPRRNSTYRGSETGSEGEKPFPRLFPFLSGNGVAGGHWVVYKVTGTYFPNMPLNVSAVVAGAFLGDAHVCKSLEVPRRPFGGGGSSVPTTWHSCIRRATPIDVFGGVKKVAERHEIESSREIPSLLTFKQNFRCLHNIFDCFISQV